MKKTVFLISLILFILILIVIGNVFLSYMWLDNARKEIFPQPSFCKSITHVIVIFPPSANKNTKLRAVIKSPILFPLGTWVMNDKGEIKWISNAEIEQLKKDLLCFFEDLKGWVT